MLLALDKASFVHGGDDAVVDDVAGGAAGKDGRLVSPRELYRFIRKYVPSFRTYHKDSYMVHRKERSKFGGGGAGAGGNMEERYRRHISPASHATAHAASASTPAIPAMVAAANGVVSTPEGCRQQLRHLANGMGSAATLSRADGKPPKPFVSPNTWERNHNVRQPSTTVVFTSAELQAIREKEKAAVAALMFKSTPDLHPSASSPSLTTTTTMTMRYNNVVAGGSTGSASVVSSGSSNASSFKSSYRSPFDAASSTASSSSSSNSPCHHHPVVVGVNNRMLTAGASTTSSVSLDLLMDDQASDADVDACSQSQSPVSSLSVSPCHSRGDSHDSVASSASSASSSSSSAASPHGTLAGGGGGHHKRQVAASSTSVSSTLLRPKRREEIECEELSKDLARQLPKNDFLSSLLDPGPEHKSPADYVGGLFDFSAGDGGGGDDDGGVSSGVQNGNNGGGGGGLSSRERMAKLRSSAPDLSDGARHRRDVGGGGGDGHHVVVSRGGESGPLPASSPYFTTSEPKAKLLTRYSSEILAKPLVHSNSKELAEKKDELLERIGKKLSVLRAERAAVEEETAMNEALGKAVSERVEAALDAASSDADGGGADTVTRKDREKFRTHVQEIDKITSLLLGLSGRLARAENALANLAEDASDQDRKILEGKRDRLVEQLDEAKQLKETIDRRSRRVSEFLARHLTPDELADYDHFVRMKAKLIVQAREIDEKIKLGEEQTTALRDALVVVPAKSS